MKKPLLIVLALGAVLILFAYGRARRLMDEQGAARAGWFRHPEEHDVTPVMLARAGELVDRPASGFRGLASDGQTYALNDLVKERPLVLIFIKEDCPCSVEAQPYFNRVHAAYGAAATFLGVIDGGEAVAREWARTRNAGYPLLCDPKLEVVHAYKAENSVYVALIAPGGKVEAYWPGFSSDMLKDLGARLARMTGAEERAIDTTDAPAQMASGCPYLD